MGRPYSGVVPVKSVPGPIDGPYHLRTRRNDSVAEVSTSIRAGRSERTHRSADEAVTLPTCTPQDASGRPARCRAGAAEAVAGERTTAAGAISEPRRMARRPGEGIRGR